MFIRVRNAAGFSLAEILVVITLLAILAGVVLFNVSGSDTGAKESALRSNIAGLREAVDMYRVDHGWFPCDPQDYNKGGDGAMFVRQLTEYTSESGRPSKKKTTTYHYGPYLKKFPEDPMTGLPDVKVDTSNERLLSDLAKAINKSSGSGGWYYEAKSGNIVANLGKDYPKTYAGF